MKKIDKLTPKQEKLVPKYLDKWLKNGYRTDAIDRAKAKESIRWLYVDRMKRPEPIIWWSDSPLQANLTIAILKNIKPELLKESVGDNLWDNLGDNLWDNLGANLRANLWDNLRDNLGDKKIESQRFETLNWEFPWVGFYDFILHELFPDEVSKYFEFQKLIEASQALHVIYPFNGICFVVECPTAIHIVPHTNGRNRLHRDGGFALEYKDGYGVGAINGVRVPDWIAVTPSAELDVKKILAETNVDIRREGLRRVGLDRLLEATKSKELDKSVDHKRGKHWDYTVYDCDFGDRKTRRFLRMYDVASKGYCFERVEDDCDTVLKALAMRDGERKFIEPSIVT